MESKFRSFLMTSGISEAAIKLLEEELVVTSAVFRALREEHFEKLLPKLKVGEHAALLREWENSVMHDTEVGSPGL